MEETTRLSPDGNDHSEWMGRAGPRGRERYPYAIVWSPLPPITWICPIIGHMGICDSDGTMHDFQGPYTIGHGGLAFGPPTRYIKLSEKYMHTVLGEDHESFESRSKKDLWDDSVEDANMTYEGRMHNICFQNCHSHVATALEGVRYRKLRHWNMVMLAFWVFFCGRFISFGRFLITFLPSIILYSTIIYVQTK